MLDAPLGECESCAGLKKRLLDLKKQLLNGVDADHVDTLDEVCELLGMQLEGSEVAQVQLEEQGERGHSCQRWGPRKIDQVESRSIGIQVDRIQIEDTSLLVYDSEDERQAQQGVAVDTARSSTVGGWLFSDMGRLTGGVESGLGQGVLGNLMSSDGVQADLARRMDQAYAFPPGRGGHSNAEGVVNGGGRRRNLMQHAGMVAAQGGHEIRLPRFAEGKDKDMHKVRGMIREGLSNEEIAVRLAEMPGTRLADREEIDEIRRRLSESNEVEGVDQGAYSTGESAGSPGEDEPSRNHESGPTYRVTAGDPFVPMKVKDVISGLQVHGGGNLEYDGDGSDSDILSTPPPKKSSSMLLAVEAFVDGTQDVARDGGLDGGIPGSKAMGVEMEGGSGGGASLARVRNLAVGTLGDEGLDACEVIM